MAVNTIKPDSRETPNAYVSFFHDLEAVTGLAPTLVVTGNLSQMIRESGGILTKDELRAARFPELVQVSRTSFAQEAAEHITRRHPQTVVEPVLVPIPPNSKSFFQAYQRQTAIIDGHQVSFWATTPAYELLRAYNTPEKTLQLASLLDDSQLNMFDFYDLVRLYRVPVTELLEAIVDKTYQSQRSGETPATFVEIFNEWYDEEKTIPSLNVGALEQALAACTSATEVFNLARRTFTFPNNQEQAVHRIMRETRALVKDLKKELFAIAKLKLSPLFLSENALESLRQSHQFIVQYVPGESDLNIVNTRANNKTHSRQAYLKPIEVAYAINSIKRVLGVAEADPLFLQPTTLLCIPGRSYVPFSYLCKSSPTAQQIAVLGSPQNKNSHYAHDTLFAVLTLMAIQQRYGEQRNRAFAGGVVSVFQTITNKQEENIRTTSPLAAMYVDQLITAHQDTRTIPSFSELSLDGEKRYHEQLRNQVQDILGHVLFHTLYYEYGGLPTVLGFHAITSDQFVNHMALDAVFAPEDKEHVIIEYALRQFGITIPDFNEKVRATWERMYRN